MLPKIEIVPLYWTVPNWVQEISDNLARKGSDSTKVEESEADRERRKRFIEQHIGLGESLVPARASNPTGLLLPCGSIAGCVGF